MDPQTNQNLRARGRGASTLLAPLYGLAAASMVGAVVLAGAPPGVRWGMLLIGYALLDAARSASVTVEPRAVEGRVPVRQSGALTRDVRARSGLAVQRRDRRAGDAPQRAGRQPGVQRAVGVAEPR
jgi:hypothetical protein